MGKYVFNAMLFRKLYRIVGTKRKNLVEVCGVHPSSFDYWMKNGDLPLAHLVRICDYTKVPISYFFLVEGDKVVIKGRGEYVIKDEKYKPIEMRLDLVAEDLSVHAGVSTRRAIAKTGISSKTFYDWFGSTPSESLKVQAFLKVMNDNNFYPGDYVIDRNRKIVLIDGVERRSDDVEKKLAAALKRAADAERQEKVTATINRTLRDEIKTLKAALHNLIRGASCPTYEQAEDVFESMVAEYTPASLGSEEKNPKA